MSRFSVLTALGAPLLALSVAVAPAHVHAQTRTTPPVHQGDILTTPQGDCTVGYVDGDSRTSLTAAHCGNDGDRVGFITSRGQEFKHTGTLRHPSGFSRASGSNDFAVVHWDNHVGIGTNAITGDAMVSANDITNTDRICFFGAHSHAPHDTGSCGTYRDKLGNTIIFRATPPPHAGDSGGPVWVDGKGFVGVISKGTRNNLATAVIPEDDHQLNFLPLSSVLAIDSGSDGQGSAQPGEASSKRLGNASSMTAGAAWELEHQAWAFVGTLIGIIGSVASAVAAVIIHADDILHHLQEAVAQIG